MRDFVFLSKKGERDKQEDFYGNAGREFFVVADGLGGHPAGEIAAETAVKAALEEHKKARKLKEPRKTLKRIFEAADRAVYEKAQRENKQGMSTTMVCVLRQEDKLFFGNIGDSRGYVLADDEFIRVTKDHRDGRYLTQSLGLGDKVSLDIYRVEAEKIELVLLCTDGLTDFVKDSAIEKILRSGVSLKKKAEGLIEVAFQMGSTDNVTVGLIKILKSKIKSQNETLNPESKKSQG